LSVRSIAEADERPREVSSGAEAARPSVSTVARVELACASVILILGGAQAWLSRNFINADGVSYLDLSDQYLRGSAHQIWNAYWSPMYSWILAAVRSLFRVAPESEYPLAHALNFAILVWALLAFRFLLKEVSLRRAAAMIGTVSESFFMAAGYAVFAWCSLALIGLRLLTPDLLEAGFVFLATGLLARIARGDLRLSTHTLLGVVLALGYFAKAPLFPVGFAFLAAAALLPRMSARSVKGALLAAATFLAVSAVWIVPLSTAKGRLTFGDSGKLNYAWYVNDVQFRHWQGGPARSGAPTHPTRAVLSEPPVFEFGSPIQGTYPVWADPSYWYDGLRVHIDMPRELVRLRANAKLYYRTFLNPHLLQLLRERHVALTSAPLLLAYGLILLLIRRKGSRYGRNWLFAFPAIAAIALLSLVYVEPRHLAPYLAVIALIGFAAVGWAPDLERPGIRGLGAALLASVFALTTLDTLRPALSSPDQLGPSSTQSLIAAGLRPGIRLASLDYSTNHIAWARVIRARFVAEIFRDAYRERETEFWTLGAEQRDKAIAAFRVAGAEAIVARDAPPEARDLGWVPIAGTRSSVLLLH
jgi:hypothetical protein